MSLLNGNIARNDNNLSIGLANPHLHDNTIQINANPQADTVATFIFQFRSGTWMEANVGEIKRKY